MSLVFYDKSFRTAVSANSANDIITMVATSERMATRHFEKNGQVGRLIMCSVQFDKFDGSTITVETMYEALG